MSLKPCTKAFKLNTGDLIPAIGLGTWKASAVNEAKLAVYNAIKVGYRHIDTAYVYGNEREIGEGVNAAIKDGLVTRKEMFITTKLWCFDHDKPLEALKGSLERLGLDYIDLYLMHWPIAIKKTRDANGNLVFIAPLTSDHELLRKDWTFFDTWKEMEKLVGLGLTRNIGVSNFNAGRLKALCEVAKVIPAANQVQIHPILPEIELSKVAEKYGVVLEAYSPLGSENTPLLKDEFIQKIAEKNGIPAANVIFSWIVGRGIVVLPKSVKESRIISNLETIELSKEDMDALSGYAASRGGEERVYASKWIPAGFWKEYA